MEQFRKVIQDYLGSGVTAYQVAKQLGVAPNAISNYINGTADIGNMSLNRAEQIYQLAVKTKEENKMKEQISKLIEELLTNDRNGDQIYTEGSFDVYYEPNENNIWIADRGMAYDGTDRHAYEVAIVDDGEVDIRL